MAKRKGRMPTIWEVDDELWRLIKPIIDADMPRKRTGRPPTDRRKVLNCIIHRMRPGAPGPVEPTAQGTRIAPLIGISNDGSATACC